MEQGSETRSSIVPLLWLTWFKEDEFILGENNVGSIVISMEMVLLWD